MNEVLLSVHQPIPHNSLAEPRKHSYNIFVEAEMENPAKPNSHISIFKSFTIHGNAMLSEIIDKTIEDYEDLKGHNFILEYNHITYDSGPFECCHIPNGSHLQLILYENSLGNNINEGEKFVNCSVIPLIISILLFFTGVFGHFKLRTRVISVIISTLLAVPSFILFTLGMIDLNVLNNSHIIFGKYWFGIMKKKRKKKKDINQNNHDSIGVSEDDTDE